MRKVMNGGLSSDHSRVFFTANLAMFMIGLGFAVRATIASSLQSELFDRIDLAHSAAMVGAALGATFSGFALTLCLVARWWT
jgi:hypothetical protein